MSIAQSTPQRFRLGLLACIVVALPVGFDVELVGRVTGTELALLGVLPFAMFAERMPPVTWPVRTLILLALIWLVAQFASDVVNGSTPDNMARGVARAGITAMLILGFFAVVADRMQHVRMIFLALSVGLIIGSVFNPAVYSELDPWKFGYGFGVSMLMVAAAGALWTLGQRPGALILCLAASLLNLYMGFRSMAGILFMADLLLGLAMVMGARARAFSAFQVGMTILVLGLGGAGLIEVYARAAQDGLLGDEALEKFEQQVDDRGVLLSGRSEFPIAFAAIREKPLLGHGSWAANEQYAVLAWEQVGISVDAIPDDVSDLIPTHSHLMGAWVEGGILAALFWFYVLAMLARAMIAMVRNAALADPVTAFLLMNLAWSVPFSPYGLTNRVLSCFAVVVLATVLRLDAVTGRAGEGVRR